MYLENDLRYYCAHNNTKKATLLLKDHIADKLDITFDGWVCWKLAITRNNDDIFKALLDYYTETKLQRDGNQEEYRKALYDLHLLMGDIEKNHPVTSQSIQDLIDKYVIYDTAKDLKNIKSKTSAVGLRVPCLDDLESMKEEEKDIECVKQVLDQLLHIREFLERTNKVIYIAKYQNQAEVINTLIKLLEDQYDLSRDTEEEMPEAYDESSPESDKDVTCNPIKGHVKPYNIADWLQSSQPSEFHGSNETLSATYASDSESLGQVSNLGEFHT